jgi:Holliday junction resolvase RusA-like endonuclease
VAKGKRPPRPLYSVGVRAVPPRHMPFTARAVIDAVYADRGGRSTLSFSFEGLPPSTNEMYIHTRFNTRLTPETKHFRDVVFVSIGAQKFTFKTYGSVAAIYLFESPDWVTKAEQNVAQKDVDNLIKPLSDAIALTTLIPDETTWEYHAYKMYSRHCRTTVYLIDLGDVVDLHL